MDRANASVFLVSGWLISAPGSAGRWGLRDCTGARVEQSMDDCLHFFLSLSFQDVASIPFPQASSWGVLLRPRLSEFVSGFVTEVTAVISTLRLS